MKKNNRYKYIIEEIEEYGKELPWYLRWIFSLKRIFTKQFSKKKILLEYCTYLLKQSSIIDLPVSVDESGLSSVEINKLFIEIPFEILRQGTQIDFIANVEEQYDKHRKRLAYAIEIDKAVRDGEDTLFGGHEKYKIIENGLKDGQKLILLGNPGSGKSTTLNFILLKSCHQYQNNKRNDSPLPILIKCRDIGRIVDETSLEEIIRNQFKTQQRSEKWTNELVSATYDAIETGGVILFIDGLDEIPLIQERLMFCKKLTAFENSFSNATILITSRIVGFNSVREQFGFKYDILSISDLSIENKIQYIHKWANTFVRKDNITATSILIDIVCNTRNISRLTENMLMLTVICQLFFKNKSLPQRRVDVYRNAILELIDRRQHDMSAKHVSINEVLPQLEYIAFQMRKLGVQAMTKNDIISHIYDFRDENKNIEEFSIRTPSELIGFLQNYSGIINCSGKIINEKGVENEVYQFSHQSLQEYLSGQALLHGWISSEKTKSHSERIKNIISSIEVKEILIENLKWRNATEFVLAEYWQESIRMYVAELDEENAITCIDLILDSHFVVSDQKHQRACSIFAAQCLMEEPKVNHLIVEKIIDCLIECINDLDGYDTLKNTAIDEVFYSLSQSKWNYIVEAKLLSKYKIFRYEKQNHVGRVLASFLNSSGQNFKNGEINSDEFHYIIKNAIEDNVIKYCLRLMEFCFQNQTKKSFTENDIGELKKIKADVVNCLGDITAQPIALSLSWLLAWVSNAKDHLVEEKLIYFLPEEIESIYEFSRKWEDENIRMWNALLLTQRKEVHKETDWIYDFAVIADGGKSWRSIVFPSKANSDKYIEELIKILESSVTENTRRMASIALGRLRFYPDAAQQSLFELFLDIAKYKDTRDEAICYISFAKADNTSNKLYETYLKHYNDVDDWIASRCYLALIGIGDVEFMKKLILQNVEKKEHNLDDKFPAFYVLIAKNDKESNSFLKNIADGDDELLKEILIKTRNKAREWVS